MPLLPAAPLQWLAAPLLLLVVSASTAHASWTDVTTPALADTPATVAKKGLSMVDWDGDGDLDIACTGEGSRFFRLVRNDGPSGFVDVTSGPLLAPGSGSSLTWGDYDGDGDLDLFVALEEVPPKLFRHDGGSAFTDVTAGPMTAPAHGHSSAWVDFDLDGDLDLYVANLNQPSRLFRNDNGAFVDATVDSLGAVNGDGVAWGDYDNDGDSDLYLSRFGNKSNFLFNNQGGGAFLNATQGVTGFLGNNHACAWADANNDGNLDLYITNANQPNRLLRNNGNGTFTDATTAPLFVWTHSVSPCWGDYDNDGDLDLYVTVSDDTLGGGSHMFRNDGNMVFVDVTEGPLFGTGYFAGCANGDYDGDGDLDLYAGSYASRPNRLMRNDLANGNHWFELDLVGTVSNHTAIGTRVEVYAGGKKQIREVSACTGYRSQSSLTVHFGLGASATIDSLRIRWPSGYIQDSLLVPANRRIKMVERPSGPPLSVPAADLRVALGIRPQPLPGRGHITFGLAAPARATLRVHDAAGRAVRTLVDGPLAAGRQDVMWTGDDDAGRQLSPGVYFVRLARAGVSPQTAKVLLIDP